MRQRGILQHTSVAIDQCIDKIALEMRRCCPRAAIERCCKRRGGLIEAPPHTGKIGALAGEEEGDAWASGAIDDAAKKMGRRDRSYFLVGTGASR